MTGDQRIDNLDSKWTIAIEFEEATIIWVYAPVAEHAHLMKHVSGILKKAMKMETRNKVVVGDLNTDFGKNTVNKEVFEHLLLENRGQRLENQMWTYRKGSKESNIDHTLVFAKRGELDNIGYCVL